jgi:hypothetical protein
MVDPEPLSRTLEYRGRWLRVSRTDKQWPVEIVATPSDSDSPVLRGWDEEEVLRRAKLRVDDMHERRHP